MSLACFCADRAFPEPALSSANSCLLTEPCGHVCHSSRRSGDLRWSSSAAQPPGPPGPDRKLRCHASTFLCRGSKCVLTLRFRASQERCQCTPTIGHHLTGGRQYRPSCVARLHAFWPFWGYPSRMVNSTFFVNGLCLPPLRAFTKLSPKPRHTPIKLRPRHSSLWPELLGSGRCILTFFAVDWAHRLGTGYCLVTCGRGRGCSGASPRLSNPPCYLTKKGSFL